MYTNDISNDQSTVYETYIAETADVGNLVLKLDSHRLIASENTFDSSAAHAIPLNIAHKVIAVKTIVCDSYYAVLLVTEDSADKSTKIQWCHWKTHQRPTFETLLTQSCPVIPPDPQHIKGTLYCMLLSKDTAAFLDISKPAIVGQVRVKDVVKRLLLVFCEENCYIVVLQCFSLKDKTLYLKALKVNKLYELSNDEVDVNDFIPSLYAQVITCVAGKSWQICNDHQKALHNSVYVCTNRKQLVCFQDGRLARCTPLPFDDACKIRLFETPSFKKMVIVQNEKRTLVCIDEETGELIHSFHDVREFLVDDFLCCGAEQLLIVFNQSLASFILLDFESVHIDKRNKDSTNKGRPSEKVGTEQLTQVLNALSHRLQIGQASLVQSEACLKEKDALIQTTCRNIEKMALGEKSCLSTHNDLVPLLPLNRQPTMKSVPDLSEKRTTMQVLSTWKRLLFDNIVIGVKLKNSTSLPLLKPCLQIVPNLPHRNTTNVTCISRLFVQSLSIPDNAEKRLKRDKNIHTEFQTVDQIEPGQNFYVTGTVPASNVAQWDKLDTTLCLLWHSEREEETTGDGRKERGDIRNKGRVVVIEHTRILGRDLSRFGMSCCRGERQELTDHETFHELLSLHTVQLHSKLLVRSTVSPVNAVHRILTEELGFHQYDAFQCLICCENRGLFYHVRAKLDMEERCQGYLQIWTRDVPQLLLLLRTIYSYSPDDLLILPANQSACNKEIKAAMKAMHHEISLVSGSLQKMMESTSADEQEDTIAMETDNELSKAQRSFQTERSRAFRNKRKTVEACNPIYEGIKKAQVKSDEAVFKMTSAQ